MAVIRLGWSSDAERAERRASQRAGVPTSTEDLMSPTSSIRVALTLLVGIAGLMGCMPAMMSPMIFDAPGSERNPAAWIFLLSLGTFPIMCLAAIIAAWRKTGETRASLWWFAMPLVNVVVVAIILILAQIIANGRIRW
jgi:sulfite exporter TauE/SafE